MLFLSTTLMYPPTPVGSIHDVDDQAVLSHLHVSPQLEWKAVFGTFRPNFV